MNAVVEKISRKYAKTIDLSDSLQAPLLNWGYGPADLSMENVVDRSDTSVKLITKIVQEANILPHHHVLDIGCGPGGTSIKIQEMTKCEHVTGIDICLSEIEYARKRLESRPESQSFVSYEEMNATDLQYKDEQFDIVAAVECAFHFHYRADFLKESMRVLKPGGQLILTDWIKGQPADSGFNKQLDDAALKFGGIPKENIIDTQAYLEMLKELGFKNIGITPISEQVIPHYTDYIKSKRGQKELIKTTGRVKTWTYIMMLQAVMFLYKQNLVDYVLVKAEKPT